MTSENSKKRASPKYTGGKGFPIYDGSFCEVDITSNGKTHKYENTWIEFYGGGPSVILANLAVNHGWEMLTFMLRLSDLHERVYPLTKPTDKDPCVAYLGMAKHGKELPDGGPYGVGTLTIKEFHEELGSERLIGTLDFNFDNNGNHLKVSVRFHLEFSFSKKT